VGGAQSAVDDPVLLLQATQLPCRLSEEELLCGAAQSVGEIAGWRAEGGDPLAACSLQLLAVRLLDRLLASLTAPPAATPHSDVPAAARDDTAHPAHAPRADVMVDVALDHGPERGCSDACPPTSHAAPPPAHLSPKRQRLLGAARSLFARQLHATAATARDLARRDSALAVPCALGLVWQGMLSLARSAGMDETFGAHARAVRGYAQAATLVWLLAWRDDAPPAHVDRQPSLTSARTSLPAVPEHCARSEAQGSVSSSVSVTEECQLHTSTGGGAMAAYQGEQGTAHDLSDSGHCQTLVDALQSAAHCNAPAPPPGPRLLDWDLTVAQQESLQSYLAQLYQRHAACVTAAT